MAKRVGHQVLINEPWSDVSEVDVGTMAATCSGTLSDKIGRVGICDPGEGTDEGDF